MRMRVRNVHEIKVRGRSYFYHRKTRKRIAAVPGTAAFLEEVAAEDAKASSKNKPKHELRELIERYKRSAEFKSLGTRTRKDYDGVLEWLSTRNYPVLAVIATVDIVSWRDTALEERGSRFANYVLAVASIIFNWGIEYGLAERNPVGPVRKVKFKRETEANRPWTSDERMAVLAAAPKDLKLPIALAMFSAIRLGDVLKMPWSAFANGTLEFIQEKTGAVRSALAGLLNSTPKRSTLMCVNSRGLPWTKAGFSCAFRKVVYRLHREGRVGPGLTFHGLRHSVATDIAELEAATKGRSLRYRATGPIRWLLTIRDAPFGSALRKPQSCDWKKKRTAIWFPCAVCKIRWCPGVTPHLSH